MFGKQISPRIRFKHILNIILLSFNLFATIHYDTAEIVSENEAYRSHKMAMTPPPNFFFLSTFDPPTCHVSAYSSFNIEGRAFKLVSFCSEITGL